MSFVASFVIHWEFFICFVFCITFQKNILNRLGKWEFDCAFDPNRLDSFNQTPLYIACLSGNDYIIERLLNWRLVGRNTERTDSELLLCPIDLNIQCGFVRETALMAAVRGEFLYIVSVLLRNGIDPNVYSNSLTDNMESQSAIGNAVLLEAVRQKSYHVTELLLRYNISSFYFLFI